MTHIDRRIIDMAMRQDFLSFLRGCVSILNPGVPFQQNWHHEAIAYQLERVRRGEIRRLIINMPPRSLKSIMVSVAFPAYWLGHNPNERIRGLSYGAELAEKHAADFRSIVESPFYRRIFPGTQVKRSTRSEVETTAGGFRIGSSMGGTLTGLGGHCFIIDDPIKPLDAQSDIERGKINQWYANTLISRLDDKATGAIIIVMQRVHIDDLTGFLLEKSDEWTVLNLPAIAEEEEKILLADKVIHVRRVGEALHPEREPLAILDRLRLDMGADHFAAQYQQQPVPPGGGAIKAAHIRYYDKAPEEKYPAKIIQSWDTAAKDGPDNAWSVCTTWLKLDKHFYLLDLTRDRYRYLQLRETALALAERFKPNVILVEDASTGTALIEDLKAACLRVEGVKPEHDKVTRMLIQQAKFETGLVLFPKGAKFLPDLEAELLTFPYCRHFDQVDSISQALGYKPKYNYDTSMRWVTGR